MLYLRSFTGFSLHLEYWNAVRYIWSIEYVLKEKLKKFWDIQVWVLWRSSRGRPENVLGTSRINLPGTALERHIRTSPGLHFRTSDWDVRGTSDRDVRRSNRIFRRRPGNVLGTFWWPIFAYWVESCQCMLD